VRTTLLRADLQCVSALTLLCAAALLCAAGDIEAWRAELQAQAEGKAVPAASQVKPETVG
jgi:hypothetical protein